MPQFHQPFDPDEVEVLQVRLDAIDVFVEVLLELHRIPCDLGIHFEVLPVIVIYAEAG